MPKLEFITTLQLQYSSPLRENLYFEVLEVIFGNSSNNFCCCKMTEFVAHGIKICCTWDSNLWHMGLKFVAHGIEFVAHGFHIPQFCGIWLW